MLSFLPQITKHTHILTGLTLKECNKYFLSWEDKHETAFEAIKKTVVSRECLTTIDFTLMPEHRIFVTTDASDYQSGVVLSFGESWETAHPVAFDSMMFKGVELNYPVHEKEMLAIIRALQRLCSDLIGVPFMVYTDHKTLENFDCQCDLSQQQSRWMEFMSQYDCKIVYVKGEENCVADALSQTSFKAEELASIPYLPDNCDVVGTILRTKHDSFMCAHVMAKPGTLAPCRSSYSKEKIRKFSKE